MRNAARVWNWAFMASPIGKHSGTKTPSARFPSNKLFDGSRFNHHREKAELR
jgi:hypothetical protein